MALVLLYQQAHSMQGVTVQEKERSTKELVPSLKTSTPCLI